MIDKVLDDKSFFQAHQINPSGLTSQVEGVCWLNGCNFSYMIQSASNRVSFFIHLVDDEKLVRNYFVQNTSTNEIIYVSRMELTRKN